MPRVPEIQRQQVDAPFPNVRVGAAPTADTYGGQIGQTLESTGVRFYDLMTRQANQTAVFEADRKLADKQTQLEQQLPQIQGKAALGASGALMEQFDAYARDIQDGTTDNPGLSNPQQRGAFAHTALLRRQQFDEQVQRHTNSEIAKWQNQESEAVIASSEDRIRRNPEYPNQVKMEMARAKLAVHSWAERHGMTGEITPGMAADAQFQAGQASVRSAYPERTKQMQTAEEVGRFYTAGYHEKMDQVESRLHRAVVNGFLAKDQDIAAKDYLTANRGKFVAADMDALEKNVLEGSTRGEARRLVDQTLGTVGSATPAQQKDVLDKIRAEPNDKVAALAEQTALHRFAVTKQLDTQAHTDRFLAASKAIEDVGVSRADQGARDIIKPPLWNLFTPQEQETLTLKRARMLAPDKIVSDLPTQIKFYGMSDADVAKIDPVQMTNITNNLDRPDSEAVLKHWSAVRNKEAGSKDKKNEVGLTNNQMMEEALDGSGYFDLGKNEKKWTPEMMQSRINTRGKMNVMLDSLPAGTPTDVIQKKLKEVVDEEIKTQYQINPGGIRGFFGITRSVPGAAIDPYAEKDPAKIRLPIASIPEPVQNLMKGKLLEAKKTVTNDKVERMSAVSKLYSSGKLTKPAAEAAMQAIIGE